MKLTTKYVAFDVHQATTVASVRDDSGRVLARSVLETHGPSIVEFLRGMRGAVDVRAHCCTSKSILSLSYTCIVYSFTPLKLQALVQ